MQGFTAFLIYISIFVKQKGIAMKTTAEIIEILSCLLYTSDAADEL